jgi:hypothetical protein
LLRHPKRFSYRTPAASHIPTRRANENFVDVDFVRLADGEGHRACECGHGTRTDDNRAGMLDALIRVFPENMMTITAIRKSDTEVQIEQTIYAFGAKDDADEFMRCLADTSVDVCKERHPPISVQAVPQPKLEEPDRGSSISPTVGGMPL